MYTKFNYRTKKALKEAVASGERPRLLAAGPFDDANMTGTTSVEGPHYPEAHTWYATVQVNHGYIIRVIS